MATKTYVNIKRGDYAKYLIVGNPGSGTPILEKGFADALAAAAKLDNGKFVVNSALRTDTYNKDKFGSSHSFGESVDIQKFVPNPGSGASKLSDKASQAALMARFCIGPNRPFDSGTDFKLGTAGDDVMVVRSNDSVVTKEGNSAETMHVGTLRQKGMSPDQKAASGAAVQTAIKTQIGMSSTGVITPDRSKMDEQERTPEDFTEMTVVTDADGKYISSSLSYSEVGALPKKVISDMAVRANPNVDVRRAKVSINGKDITNVYVGKTGDKRASSTTEVGYNGGKTSIAYVEVTKYQLPDDNRAVTSSDLSIAKSLEDKRVKNVSDGFCALGTLAKYREAEQPASVRLILDKLFESERSDAAKKAWQAYEDAKVTYIDQFIMDRVSVQSKEAYRVVASLGEEYKVYFGTSAPEVLAITGYTLNTANQQWLYDFKYFYERYLKGSRLVENRLRAFLTFTDAIYEVLPVGFSYSESAKIPGAVTISIDCIILQFIPFGNYKDPLTRSKPVVQAPNASYSAAQTQMPAQTRAVVAKTVADQATSAGKTDEQRNKEIADSARLVKVSAGRYPVKSLSTNGVDIATTTSADGQVSFMDRVPTEQKKVDAQAAAKKATESEKLAAQVATTIKDQAVSVKPEVILTASRAGGDFGYTDEVQGTYDKRHERGSK